MPDPILIHIYKKTLVRTKKQIRNNFRSDWKPVGIIDYDLSACLLQYISHGPIRNDAQFIKVILDNYGPGEYFLIYWRKGMRGFRKFMQFICDAEEYQQTKASNPRWNAKKINLFLKIKKLKKLFRATTDEGERTYLRQEIGEYQRELDLPTRHPGPYPYLKSIRRKFEPHGYDEADEETEEAAEKIRYEGEWAWLGEQLRKDEEGDDDYQAMIRDLEEQERTEEKEYWEEHDISYVRDQLDYEGLNEDPSEDPDEDEADEMQDLY